VVEMSLEFWLAGCSEGPERQFPQEVARCCDDTRAASAAHAGTADGDPRVVMLHGVEKTAIHPRESRPSEPPRPRDGQSPDDDDTRGSRRGVAAEPPEDGNSEVRSPSVHLEPGATAETGGASVLETSVRRP
jgi:hypothetical protein